MIALTLAMVHSIPVRDVTLKHLRYWKLVRFGNRLQDIESTSRLYRPDQLMWSINNQLHTLLPNQEIVYPVQCLW